TTPAFHAFPTRRSSDLRSTGCDRAPAHSGRESARTDAGARGARAPARAAGLNRPAGRGHHVVELGSVSHAWEAGRPPGRAAAARSEEHTSELQSRVDLV